MCVCSRVCVCVCVWFLCLFVCVWGLCLSVWVGNNTGCIPAFVFKTKGSKQEPNRNERSSKHTSKLTNKIDTDRKRRSYRTVLRPFGVRSVLPTSSASSSSSYKRQLRGHWVLRQK